MFSLRRKTEEPDVDLRLSDEQRAVRETFAALFRKESTPQRAGFSNRPHTRKLLAEHLVDVPDDEARKIVELNARTL